MARSRTPIAQLDHQKFEVLLGLDVSELLATAVLVVFLPLFAVGMKLPQPWWLISCLVFPGWAIVLFFVRREQKNVAEWLGLLVPYWFGQHRWVRRQGAVDDPRVDLLDATVTASPNPISWIWKTGTDGVRELHIYEEPMRPYRAWIARANEQAENRRAATAAGVIYRPTRVRPEPVELP